MRAWGLRGAATRVAASLTAVAARVARAADGQPLKLGQSNAATAQTQLARKGGAAATALRVDNAAGIGISATTASAHTALQAVGRLSHAVSGETPAPDGVGGFFRNTRGAGTLGTAVMGLSASGKEADIPSAFRDPAGVFVGPNGIIGVASTDSTSGYGVIALSSGSSGLGLYANNSATNGLAALFLGNVHIMGTLSKTAGGFRIDHPLDPADKVLSHSFVESPDMKNLYDGTVTTDANGEATVTLPAYFEALNRDVRYQLTVVGPEFAQARVTSKVVGNRFAIKTDRPRVEVCWQVTGIRQDAYAKAHPIVVEEDKPANERGMYLAPTEHGKPETAGIGQRGQDAAPRPPRATAATVDEPDR